MSPAMQTASPQIWSFTFTVKGADGNPVPPSVHVVIISRQQGLTGAVR